MKIFTMNTCLLDSNLLIYAYNIDSVENALNCDIDAYVADKNLFEFFAVITDPKRVSKPLTVHEAIKVIKVYQESNYLKILHTSPQTHVKAFELAEEYNISKQDIFDVVLVAIMLENDVHCIYTRNDQHFKIFDFLTVINPFE